jgi:hypothetical protein
MLAQVTKVEEVIDASQQMFARDVIIEVEGAEELEPPSIDVFQDTQQSTERATFSTPSLRSSRCGDAISNRSSGSNRDKSLS